MLILTRNIGEMIRIGDEVTVRVLAVRGGQVSLGFTAPSEVRIFREEVVRDERSAPEEAAVARAREPMRGERGSGTKPPAKLGPSAGSARKVASGSA